MLLDEVLSSGPVDVDSDEALLGSPLDQLIHFHDKFLQESNNFVKRRNYFSPFRTARIKILDLPSQIHLLDEPDKRLH